MSMRAFALHALSRVLLITAVFVIGFGLDGHAQTSGSVEGRLASSLLGRSSADFIISIVGFSFW